MATLRVSSILLYAGLLRSRVQPAEPLNLTTPKGRGFLHLNKSTKLGTTLNNGLPIKKADTNALPAYFASLIIPT